ncbi:MAG: TfoX/Sxy family protein [Alphaproteobacteria bacterium]|nr:TfoX/Sxy family protein [Alphaproteobacteria bacterium]
MPYDFGLAERLAEIVGSNPGMNEKKMFGGIGWLLNGNMCVGVYKDWLIIRIGQKQADALSEVPYVKPMDITGKPMKGWAMVSPKGYESDKNLERYVKIALSFVNDLPPK